MNRFEQKYEEWLRAHVAAEPNRRRRELLEKGLGHGTVELLRSVWFPAVGNLDHLYPEWEVIDFHNGYRYLDLAYMPGGVKGNIEIQGYGAHARDLDVRRFKDLCWRHSLLALDGWITLPIAYLSIKEETARCRQLILSFIGKFMSTEVQAELSWQEAEIVRYARRLMRPITPVELAAHLRVTERHTRRHLHNLVDRGVMSVKSGNHRYRLYGLRTEQPLFGENQRFENSNGQGRRYSP